MIIAKRFILSIIVLTLTNLNVTAQAIISLKQAIQTAKQNNPILKSQKINLDIAQTDIITAKLRPNPILNNQSLQLTQPSFFPPNTDWSSPKNRQIWWQLTKPFQLPAQRKYKIDVAQKNAQFSQSEYLENERNVFLNVATIWLDVWFSKNQINVLQLAKSNIDTLVQINKLRLKNQVITETDLIRTEILANQYTIQIKTVEQNYKNELITLKYLLGSQQEITIDTTLNFENIFTKNIDSLLQIALTYRGDIQSVKSSIEVAKSNIKLQKALAFPQPELGMIYNPQNTISYVGFYGTIEIPLFSRNQGEIKKSHLLQLQSEQNLIVTQQQIQSEIINAYNTYKTENQNLLNYESLLTQSEKILLNVKYSYLRGGTTIIDYLEAQRSWLETKQQYYQTTQLYQKSYIQLLYTSGLINQLAN